MATVKNIDGNEINHKINSLACFVVEKQKRSWFNMEESKQFDECGKRLDFMRRY
jgi:hypothetical protein